MCVGVSVRVCVCALGKSIFHLISVYQKRHAVNITDGWIAMGWENAHYSSRSSLIPRQTD